VAAKPADAKLIAAEVSVRQRFGYPCTHYSHENLPAILSSNAYFGALRFGGTLASTAIAVAPAYAKVCSRPGRGFSNTAKSPASWRTESRPQEAPCKHPP
jgi:hypothetical protein